MGNKKKEYWYVIVMTRNGAVFVTETNNRTRIAKWDKNNKPLELTKENAQYLALGLSINGNTAFAVGNSYEIDFQPYNYKEGNFYWRRKKVKKDD